MKSLKETHGIKFELVRHFLARMLDGEWSSTPGQWRNVVVGAFAMLVPAGLLIIREGSINPADFGKYRRLAALANPGQFQAAGLADRLALLTLVLAVTGLLALIQWQSFFPGRRDYISLAGLPIRSRQIFAARFSTVMLFSAALVAVMNFLPALIAPVEFGGLAHLHGSYLANAAAQAAASGLGCFFLLFAMVGLQGVLWNVLPARWFTRVSVYVQGLLVGVLFFVALYSWSIRDWNEKMVARLPEFAAWAPPVWFVGLHERLLGDPDPFFAAMAVRAWVALAAAAAAMLLTYVVSYRRYRQLLIEAPVYIDVPRRRQWSLLRLLARQPQQEAVMEFMSKTLARSRANRTIWLAYIGAAIALMLNSSLIDGSFFSRHGGLGKALKFAVLFWPLGISVVLLTGMRHVLRLPAELPANWIFRLTETQGRKQWMQAVERFVLCYTVVPIYVLLFPAAVKSVGWGMAVRMTVLQLIVSLTLFDLLFYGWQQLPFACSYVPGKRPMVAIVAGYMGMLCAIVPLLTIMIGAAAQFPPMFVAYLLFFGGIWIWARKRRRDGWGEDRLFYEELPEGVPDLGITEMSWHGATERTLQPPKNTPPPAPPRRAEARPTFSVWLEIFWQDVRFAMRQLHRNPGFTAIAAVTIALGIGATTSIYSMIDSVMWRPIPYPHLEKLVTIVQAIPGQRYFWDPAAPADIESIRRDDTYLESLASWQMTMVSLLDSGGEALRLEATRVTPNFLSVAGVQPALGRTFLPSEDQPGHDREVMLSDTIWRAHFGGDPGLVGRTIRLDDRNYTVVGIMPPGFYFPRPSRQIWIPLALTPEERTSRSLQLVDSGGRLSPGHTLAQFTAELNGIAARLEQQYPGTNSHRRFLAWNAQQYFAGSGSLVSVYTAMLLGAAFFVLLIACVNVANLQFARAAGRWREIAMRTALGARRSRLVRQLVTESMALAIAGAALGLLFAKWGLAVLQAHVPAELVRYAPGLAEIGLNRHALVFTLFAAVASGVLAGLLPAWRCSRANLTAALRPGRHWVRSALVGGEVALAAVLLVGAGLMVRGFQALVSSSTGLEPSRMLTLQLTLSENREPAGYFREVLGLIAALPGVQSAVAVTALPYSRHGGMLPVTIEGQPAEPGNQPTAWIQSATPGYFQSLHIPLRLGRLPAGSDGPNTTHIAVVSESVARRWWPDGSVIGRRLQVRAGDWVSIVGVVGDIEQSAVFRGASPTVYVPFAQLPERQMDIAIRTARDARSLAPAVRAAVHAVDREQPITNLNTMTALIEQEAFIFAYMAALMGVFGVLALALSSVGVYGVMAFMVSGQTHEIGVRMALGAPRGTVLAMLFRRGMRTALAGLVAGLIPAYGLARLMRAAVFGTNEVGPAVFAIPLVLAAAAAVAIYIPARRALKIDPMAALRSE
jgi:putative ABC transport system permease protein